MKNFIIIIIPILFVIAFNEKTSNIYEINVDLEKCHQLNLSKIAKEVVVIPLETKQECMLNKISRIRISKEYIYVSDIKHVYKFDIKGNFIKEIGNIGRGPNEHNIVLDFCLDITNNKVFILAYNKILKFDIDGNFEKSQKLSSSPRGIENINSTTFITSTSFIKKENNNVFQYTSWLYKYDNNLNIIDSTFISKSKLKEVFSSYNPFTYHFSYSTNEIFYYSPVLTIEPVNRDTLYKLEEKNIEPSVKFNFGEKVHKILKNQKQKSGELPYKKICILNIYATGRYFFLDYIYNDESFMGLYDTKENKYNKLQDGFYDDFYKTGVVKPRPLSNSKMYFTKQGYEAVGKISHVDENDNPVLMIVRLKE